MKQQITSTVDAAAARDAAIKRQTVWYETLFAHTCDGVLNGLVLTANSYGTFSSTLCNDDLKDRRIIDRAGRLTLIGVGLRDELTQRGFEVEMKTRGGKVSMVISFEPEGA